MGAGVSLSLPRNGFPVGLSIEISDSFARELGLSQVPSLISVSLPRELVSFYERNYSVFSQVVLVAGADLAIDLPAALKGDTLYSSSGDVSLALVFGSVVPDPVLCKGKGINVSLIPAGYRKLASYIDRVLKDGNAEVSINEAYKAGSGDLSSDLHIVVLSISELGRSDEGVRPMSSVPHGAVCGDSTNSADIFPVAATDDLAIADRASSGSAFHHGWFWFWLNRCRRWFRVKHISHSVESGTGSGGSIYYAIVGGSGNDSRDLGGGDSRFHLGSVSQSTVRSDLSSASVNNTSMWSPSQMGHRSYSAKRTRKNKCWQGLRSWPLRCLNQFIFERKYRLLRWRMCLRMFFVYMSPMG